MTTMGEAIAISSPSGRVSKRARKAAIERLRVSLFGDGLTHAPPPTPTIEQERARLMVQAKQLRDLAARGMKPRAYIKQAAALEARAVALA